MRLPRAWLSATIATTFYGRMTPYWPNRSAVPPPSSPPCWTAFPSPALTYVRWVLISPIPSRTRPCFPLLREQPYSTPAFRLKSGATTASSNASTLAIQSHHRTSPDREGSNSDWRLGSREKSRRTRWRKCWTFVIRFLWTFRR